MGALVTQLGEGESCVIEGAVLFRQAQLFICAMHSYTRHGVRQEACHCCILAYPVYHDLFYRLDVQYVQL